MSQQVQRSGMSFLEALLLVFIVLKLCGLIDWSWWWVLSPFWLPVSIFVPFVIFVMMLDIFDRER